MLGWIGNQLDEHVVPRVADGGIVVLSETAVPLTKSMEKSYGRKAKGGSAAGPRQGSAGRQGPPRGPWPSGAPAPAVRSDLQTQIEEQLSALRQQYPGTQLWKQDSGIWLLVRSHLLHGLKKHAIFAVVIDYTTALVRSWGFWRSTVTPGSWIGPRHTNGDGSVCAFDGSWSWEVSLVTLIDLYSLWAIRHLYLEVFGRWPGSHVAHLRGEKLLEFGPDEYCGCADGTKKYGFCCMANDLAEGRIERSLAFAWLGGSTRQSPINVTRFVREVRDPPTVHELLPTTKEWVVSQWHTASSLGILQGSRWGTVPGAVTT
jgi:hypothetical protein